MVIVIVVVAAAAAAHAKHTNNVESFMRKKNALLWHNQWKRIRIHVMEI